jgi:hypothetical protein
MIINRKSPVKKDSVETLSQGFVLDFDPHQGEISILPRVKKISMGLINSVISGCRARVRAERHFLPI